jgi:UDP-glucose 4-epimerase
VRCFALDVPADSGVLEGRVDSIEWITGDFSDTELYPQLLDSIDTVYHLVSTTIPSTSNEDPVFDLTSNVVTTIRFLEAIRDAGVARTIFVSSGGTVYGVPRTIPIPEDHPTDPISGYGIHKLAIEKYLHLWEHQYGLSYRVLRLSNPYGIEQVSDRPQGVIGTFLYLALRGIPIEVWGDGTVIRDYVHIDDVMNAMAAISDHQGIGRVFNIGSGQGHSLNDIVRIIENAIARSIAVTYKPARNVDVPINVLDIDRAHTELDWSPAIALADGVRHVLAYAATRITST